jgi:hypothetical protein
MFNKKTLTTISLLVVFLVTVLLIIDAITLLIPALGMVGMVMHGTAIILLCLFALFRLWALVRSSFQQKSFFTLFVLIIWIGLIGFWAHDSRSLSGETTQETACAINHLTQSPDTGLHQTCLFGYPARQYLPQAVASLLFGRSLAVVNLAGSIYFLTGLLIFASSCVDFLGKSRRADVFTASAIALLFHFKFLDHFLFHFEQSIFPLSFGLMVVGLGLSLMNRHHTALHWGMLGMVVLLLVHSYTPSLVLLGLIIPASLASLVKRTTRSFLGVWLLAVCVLAVVLSLLYRQDLSFTSDSQRTAQELVRDVIQAHTHLVIGNEAPAFASPLAQGVFIAFLLSLLVGLQGKKFLYVGWWAYAVIILAVISKGYSYYAVDFRLHRSMVIVPPLLASAMILIKPHIGKFSLKHALFVFVVVVCSGAAYANVQVARRPINTHFEVIKQIKAFETASEQTLLVTQKASESDNLISLHDTAVYFLPTLSVRTVSEAEQEDATCGELAETAELLLIDATDATCLNTLPKDEMVVIESEHLQASYRLWILRKQMIAQ